MPTVPEQLTLSSSPILQSAESPRPRIARRRISGVLLLDKPAGISSNHALQAAKRIFRAEKAGHSGTLDPLASGLLPVFFGDATRFAGHLLDSDKRYLAQIALGSTTRTGDAEGEVLERRPVNVDRAALIAVLQRFLGPQTQIPPMYSALKRDGQPLYVLARRGETVERAPRAIVIRQLDLREFAAERFEVDVICSKGTYIRTLAEDIGVALGCGAHLSGLRRTATAMLEVSQAVSLAALEEMSELERDALLRPADAVLERLPLVELDDGQAVRFCHGQTVVQASIPDGVVRVYAPGRRFLGLAESANAGRLTPKRLLGQTAQVTPTG